MNVNDLFPPSEFLKSEDVEDSGGELMLTIAGVNRREYEEEDGKKTVKGVLNFEETEKRLALNVTNTNTVAAMFGRDNIDKEWIGKSIILYVDPHVQYAGKEVKGIRVRLIDKKADAVTAYWSKTRELGFTRAEGLEHLKTFNNDFAAALAGLNEPA